MGSDLVPLIITGVCLVLALSGFVAIALFDLDVIRSDVAARGGEMIEDLEWSPFDSHPDKPAFGRAYSVSVVDSDGSRYRETYAATWTGSPKRIRREPRD